MLVGIDIGGTTTRIGVFASPTLPSFTLLARFPTYLDYEQEVRRIIGELSSLPHPIASIGVAVGARIAEDGASVAVAPNLRDYEGQPLRAELAHRLGCPVRLGHDTVCGLVAERAFGALQGAERCAYLTLSTGTGGAVYLGSGATGSYLSIEFAHQILDGNPRDCLCGQTGCLETYTGGKQIARLLGTALENITDPDFWATFVEKLALGLVNLAQLGRVARVAVSGGIALHRPELLPDIQTRLDARLHGMTLTLVPAQLGEDAPLVGAAALSLMPEHAVLH